MISCNLFKSVKRHACIAVGIVRHAADHQAWNLVGVGHQGDGGTLHFHTIGMDPFNNGIAQRFIFYENVSGGDTAQLILKLALRHLLQRTLRQRNQAGITGEFTGMRMVILHYFPIKVVKYKIPRQDDI